MGYMVQSEDLEDKVTIHEVFVDNCCFHSSCFNAVVKLNRLIVLLPCTNLLKVRACQYLCTFRLFNLDFQLDVNQSLHPPLKQSRLWWV